MFKTGIADSSIPSAREPDYERRGHIMDLVGDNTGPFTELYNLDKG
jgi:hypothetical protein